MGEWSVIRYDKSQHQIWNSLVRDSRNGTFLLEREYMDYHSDRFEDFSMLALKDNKPVAVLPANITSDRILHSHQGLTYGGWVLPPRHFDMSDFMAMWKCWLKFMLDVNITEVDYKPIPVIYPRYSSQEDLYALFRSGAIKREVDVSMALCPSSNPGFNTLQRRQLRKSEKSGCVVKEITGQYDIEQFHCLLSDCLMERHGVKPVHSLAELLLLHDLFKENIRFFLAETDAVPVAGICVYDTGIVAHAQYIATTETGRKNGGLTAVVKYLVNEVFAERKFFDFGTCNECGGKFLNEGLARQKGSYGATPVAYERYSFNVGEALSIF